VGGRYSDVSKEGGIGLLTATWVFDINPDPDGNGIVEGTEHRPQGDLLRTDLAEAIISCETGLDMRTPALRTIADWGNTGQVIGSALCGEWAGMAGFWTHEYGESDIPDAWDTMSPIGLGAFRDDLGADIGPFFDTYSEDSFDPQITLRYRPNPNHSVYAKWAKAFKAGGFDTSDRGIPRGGLRYNSRAGLPVASNNATGTNVGVANAVTLAQVDSFGPDGQKEFTYLAEHAENWELGARGTIFDGMVRYGATFFWQEIKDLQLETEVADVATLAAGLESTGRFMTNAGAQRTRGMEFDLMWAATDRLTLGATGVIQEGVMLEYIGGCTEAELAVADTGPCSNGVEVTNVNGIDVVLPEGNIDRAGVKAPRTPDWKVIFAADYEAQVFDNYVFNLNSKMAVSDAYTQDTLGFTYVQAWPTHVDLNALASIGPADGTWDVGVYGRNFFGAKLKYYPEFDETFRGLQEDDMPESSFFTYGIQFNYRYR
jgi:outer membrane receptor protein involved in Fe transport